MGKRIDHINVPLCIDPVILLRKRSPVKQQGIEQFCRVAQVCIQQKAGIGQILRQRCSDSQVIGNRIHLQRFTSKYGAKVCNSCSEKVDRQRFANPCPSARPFFSVGHFDPLILLRVKSSAGWRHLIFSQP